MSSILVIGSLNVDVNVRVDHTPCAGETILSGPMVKIPGGKGANQACALGKLGGDVAILGAVGNDNNAEIQRQNLRNAGVNVEHLIVKENAGTGMAFITINSDGDNCIVVVPGANAELRTEDIDHNRKLIENCEILIMQMEIPLPVVSYAAQIAKKYGKLVILDPAPVPKQIPGGLWNNVDIVKPNETELSMLSGVEFDKNNLESVRDAARRVQNMGPENVVVSLGEKGAYILDNSKEGGWVPSVPTQVVDTTAAGDTFTAAMALQLLNGMTLRDAVAFANIAASLTVARYGAQSSIPTMKEVSERLRKNSENKDRAMKTAR